MGKNEEKLHGQKGISRSQRRKVVKKKLFSVPVPLPHSLQLSVFRLVIVINPPRKPSSMSSFEWSRPNPRWSPAMPGNVFLLLQATPTSQIHTSIPQGLTPLFWPLHGVRLVFPNHVMSRCHTFFISGFNIAHLCSKLGLGGQLVQIVVIHLRDAPQHLGTCAHSKARSSDGETGDLDKLRPVAGMPHS